MGSVRTAALAAVAMCGVVLLPTAVGAQDGTTTLRPPVPAVSKIDRDTKKGLMGMTFDGEVCSRAPGESGWACTDLSNYGWTDMTWSSYTRGPSYDLAVAQPVAESCDDVANSTQTVEVWEVKAPKGYSLIPGRFTMCLTLTGWQVQSNTTGGGIIYSQARNAIVFRDRKKASATPPATPKPAKPAAASAPKPAVLPATGPHVAGQVQLATLLVAIGAAASAVTSRRRHTRRPRTSSVER